MSTYLVQVIISTLLRAQAASLDSEQMRPLVVMSPKSLLRNKTVAKPIDEFTSGGFEPILTESYQADKVTKVIFGNWQNVH
ncbi:2-oxoglutarate dehydrogenase E1 component [Staphylococcus aureus]|uniref:2-oxoglutarate dehydrogenase E1 component n=1 Tax=Staphylococcus aureus TaxID=1280 RepID=A0A2X2JWB6_STAAU|nr:2-oxoglutarate dehydrogenase E1 component [Staphylococcus aureus]